MDIETWLRIHDIDPETCPYCWPIHGGHIKTPFGIVEMPYGYLWDGASGVVDLVLDASAAHDKLYRLPYTRTLSEAGLAHKRRLNRVQCDLAYGYLLLMGRRPLFALVRPLGLMMANCLPCGPWSRYRRREAAMGAYEWERHCSQAYMIPEAHKWLLPTHRTRDAIYNPGGRGAAHAE